jgi:hypothetical protein
MSLAESWIDYMKDAIEKGQALGVTDESAESPDR